MTHATTDQGHSTAIGRLLGVGFGGHDGKALAAFWAAVLGWEVTQTFGDAAAMISDGTTSHVFYTARDFKAPDWPADELAFHFELGVDDVAAAEERLIALGANKPEHQPGGAHWTVLLDPSGHPFCVTARQS
ncbi:putative enzyme related to lactoylglutathione lyase [Streptomyces olivoverticillatus]|uniref:Putative enzyme related to lactoylglutathione lyase n=1 Tax=Streptomyces olivoverticillatus TaxID=66427 RepID=A0A7W7PNE2_9ACTN|nr:VOC family protein [Streptomyces olivoverticillatus]MBB4894740.1 putative enzyme related to lactoylglutathione lyase [Streptomyces olivoverticillatus]